MEAVRRVVVLTDLAERTRVTSEPGDRASALWASHDIQDRRHGAMQDLLTAARMASREESRQARKIPRDISEPARQAIEREIAWTCWPL